MDNNEPVFENERYVVDIGDFPEVARIHGSGYVRGYVVRNKETGVEECFTPSYPDAVAAAEQLDLAIANSVWKWVRISDGAEKLQAADKPMTTH